jgi:hypothetical protein
LLFDGAVIRPQDKVKLLGVTFDSQLRMDVHIAKVTAKATKQCLAIRRLRGIRPRQMRQLYNAVVTPTTDYAASVWYAPQRRGTGMLLKQLEKVQRLGARNILSAFRTVSLRVLEAETNLPSVNARLDRKVAAHLPTLLAVPDSNPIAQCMKTMPTYRTTYKSPMQQTRGLLKKMLAKRPVAVSQEPPWTAAPWTALPIVSVNNKKEATQQLRKIERTLESAAASMLMRPPVLLYTDGSIRNKLAGAAVVRKTTWRTTTVSKQTIGWETTCPALVAELKAIELAVQYAARLPTETVSQVWVFSDGLKAVQALSQPGKARIGRECVRRTTWMIAERQQQQQHQQQQQQQQQHQQQ